MGTNYTVVLITSMFLSFCVWLFVCEIEVTISLMHVKLSHRDTVQINIQPQGTYRTKEAGLQKINDLHDEVLTQSQKQITVLPEKKKILHHCRLSRFQFAANMSEFRFYLII